MKKILHTDIHSKHVKSAVTKVMSNLVCVLLLMTFGAFYAQNNQNVASEIVLYGDVQIITDTSHQVISKNTFQNKSSSDIITVGNAVVYDEKSISADQSVLNIPEGKKSPKIFVSENEADEKKLAAVTKKNQEKLSSEQDIIIHTQNSNTILFGNFSENKKGVTNFNNSDTKFKFTFTDKYRQDLKALALSFAESTYFFDLNIEKKIFFLSVFVRPPPAVTFSEKKNLSENHS